jgi:chromosome condensin MukBEF MukE localization factor
MRSQIKTELGFTSLALSDLEFEVLIDLLHLAKNASLIMHNASSKDLDKTKLAQSISDAQELIRILETNLDMGEPISPERN